jgi:hypothetical protein
LVQIQVVLLFHCKWLKTSFACNTTVIVFHILPFTASTNTKCSQIGSVRCSEYSWNALFSS